MIISVMNRAGLPDVEVQNAIRAVNRQIAEDFAPHWGLTATLRLESEGKGATEQQMRGDAIIYLVGHSTSGFHDESRHGVPYAHVFTRLKEELTTKEEEAPWLGWSVILSHETLELLADPYNNTLVKGPHPDHPHREVFHYQEICDPVQMNTYTLDGVLVSDFVLPRYFNSFGKIVGRNDFLGTSVKAFRWNPMGYIGFWDPRVGRNGHYEMYPKYKPSELPAKLMKAKGKLGRLARYKRPNVRDGTR